MLYRFADIVLGNADDAAVPHIKCKAMVTDQPGLHIPQSLIDRLQLQPVVMPQKVMHSGVLMEQQAWFPGFASVQYHTSEQTMGAHVSDSGIWLGTDIAVELGMEVKPYQEKQGEACHVLVQKNSVPQAAMQKLCDHARGQQLKPLGEEYRTTQLADLGKQEALAHQLISDLARQYIEPFYNLNIESWEPPQCMVYKEGGIYKAHADGVSWVWEDEKKTKGRWEPYMDRDISFLLYLNDDFSGGALDFPDIGFKVVPASGMMVAFPSSHSYRHEAERITGGERIVLATWMRAEGTPRNNKRPIQRFMKSQHAYKRST
ncbi:MAG: prolyl hydroxylase family protein [Alphaproteobacteria bacterium]